MVAEIGNSMADLLAAHFNSGLVAAKLGGGERPVCGNPGTGALWRDLGFVAQRYVVKVLWYCRITSFFLFNRMRGAQLCLTFQSLLDLNFMHSAFVVLDVVLNLNCYYSKMLCISELSFIYSIYACLFEFDFSSNNELLFRISFGI